MGLGTALEGGMGPPRRGPGTPDRGRAARGRATAPRAGLCRGRGDALGARLHGGGRAGEGLPGPGGAAGRGGRAQAERGGGRRGRGIPRAR
jgi:hypothetical protein